MGHALAVQLKNTHGVKDFCAYTDLHWSKNFLVSQKEINYSPILFDHEIHESFKKEEIDFDFLKKFEEDYGLPNLWPYLAPDRSIMLGILPREYPSNTPLYTHEEMLKILQVKAKAIINFLKTEKPDFIIFSAVGNLSSMIFYHAAKKMGVKTITLYFPGILNLLALTEDYFCLSWSEKKFEEIQSEKRQNLKLAEAKQFINSFREKPKTYHPDYNPEKTALNRLKQLKFIFPKNIIKNLSYLKYLVRSDKTFLDERLTGFLIDRIKRKTRSFIGYSDLYDEFTPNEDFAFFPLQLEPELSLYVWAPFITNQIELARQIAKSLPVHFKLYVKEHPLMFGYRTRKYYKELKKIPNIKLINPAIKSFDIIKRAKLITTITGNAGWEATIFQKQVITFGNIFYNKLSQIKHCKTLEELPYLVKEQLNNFKHNEEELVNFLSAIMEDSIKIDYIDLWYHEQDFCKIKDNSGIKELANLIHEKLIS